MRELSNNAVRISESDKLRSDFVRHMVQNEEIPCSHPSLLNSYIPRIVVQFWDEHDIPNDVQQCIETWRGLKASGVEHHVFNRVTARRFIAENFPLENVKAFDRCYHPAMMSDYFRLCFISCVGGFYVDVDDVYSGIDINSLFEDQKIALQAMCFDIDANEMVDPERFFVDKEFSKNWIFYFNNNPLIAPPNSPIIKYALERATRLILECDENSFPEIQSTTGPGNISASVVACLADCVPPVHESGVNILANWEVFAKTIWNLSYRNDERNWRLSNRKKYMPVKKISKKV